MKLTSQIRSPNSLVGLLDADGLAGKDLAELIFCRLKQMRLQVVTVTALSWKG